jgi:hypothetical protein
MVAHVFWRAITLVQAKSLRQPLRGAATALFVREQARGLGHLWRATFRGFVGAAPNLTLKRSTNGMPPGPGRRYAVHFRQPGPGAMPLAPA